MKLLIAVLFFLNFSINQTNLVSQPVQKYIYVMPVWITYSGSVPDSIQDFFKIYLQTKGLSIIKMKEAIELIMGQSNVLFMNNLPADNESVEEHIAKLEKMRKPVCNNLSIELFNNKRVSDQLIVDSIKWYVLQKFSLDTIRHYRTFYPAENKSNNPYLLWRNFADTIVASGLLK